jgi:hypothetical protein
VALIKATADTITWTRLDRISVWDSFKVRFRVLKGAYDEDNYTLRAKIVRNIIFGEFTDLVSILK